MKNMKTLFYYLLVCTILTMPFLHAKAQDINIGVKAGANFANVTGERPLPYEGITISPGTSMLLGAHIGAFVDIPITANFYVEPGLLWSMKGYSEDLGIAGFSLYDYQVKLNYIQIPILAKFSFSQGYGFNIFAGPYVGILVSAEQTGTIFNVSQDLDLKKHDMINPLDIGLSLGLGYRLENGLGFAAGYELGLTKVYKKRTDLLLDADGDPVLDVNLNPISVNIDPYGINSVITFGVSWLFGRN